MLFAVYKVETFIVLHQISSIIYVNSKHYQIYFQDCAFFEVNLTKE